LLLLVTCQQACATTHGRAVAGELMMGAGGSLALVMLLSWARCDTDTDSPLMGSRTAFDASCRSGSGPASDAVVTGAGVAATGLAAIGAITYLSSFGTRSSSQSSPPPSVTPPPLPLPSAPIVPLPKGTLLPPRGDSD
jgi:hypothetical protein